MFQPQGRTAKADAAEVMFQRRGFGLRTFAVWDLGEWRYRAEPRNPHYTSANEASSSC